MRLLPLLLLFACKDDDSHTEDDGLYAENYIGPEGTYLQFGPEGDPLGEPNLIMRLDANQWVLREGSEWGSATDLGTMVVDLTDGLRLDGELVLPARLQEGEIQEGVEVVSIGEQDVYYGTFLDAVRSSVSGERWLGEQVFARDLGPVLLHFDGMGWELVYYL